MPQVMMVKIAKWWADPTTANWSGQNPTAHLLMTKHPKHSPYLLLYSLSLSEKGGRRYPGGGGK